MPKDGRSDIPSPSIRMLTSWNVYVAAGWVSLDRMPFAFSMRGEILENPTNGTNHRTANLGSAHSLLLLPDSSSPFDSSLTLLDFDRTIEAVPSAKPSPITEKPLRTPPSTLCSTRSTRVFALIRGLDAPWMEGRMISRSTARSPGGQVAVKTYAPTTLISRVTPSPWKRSPRPFFQKKSAGAPTR